MGEVPNEMKQLEEVLKHQLIIFNYHNLKYRNSELMPLVVNL